MTEEIRRKALTKEAIADLVRELERQSKTKQDYVVPAEKLEMVVMQAPPADGGSPRRVARLSLRGAGIGGASPTYDVGQVAHRQIAEKLQIPGAYYQRMGAEIPELLAINVNSWLGRQTERRFMVRTLDGRARAFLSEWYRALDNVDLFYQTFDVVKRVGADIVRADLTDERFYLQALHPEWQEVLTLVGPAGHVPGLYVRPDAAPPGDPGGHYRRGDDILIPGVIVSNSEVGLGSLRAELMIFRMVCDNRLVGETGLAEVHVGSRKGDGLIDWSSETLALEARTTWSKVRDVIEAAFNRERFQRMIARLRGAQEKKIDEPVKAVDAVMERFGFTQEDREAILNEFVAPTTEGLDPGRNLYGLVQAVTARGKAYDDNYDRRIEYERAGAAILEMGTRELVPMKVR
jgi:hypothetical protein